MRLLVLICLLLAAALPAEPHAQALPPPPEEPAVIFDDPIAIDEGFALAPDERKRLEADALEGDGIAALRVSTHFNGGINADPKMEAYWRLIAAENGNAVAQYNTWQKDHDSQDVAVRTRGMFWLRRAAAQGQESAVRELERLTRTIGDEHRLER